MSGLQSLLEDYRNWSSLQDWKLQKQREEMFGGNYELAEDIGKWGGGFNPSSLGGGLAGMIKPAVGVSKVPKLQNLAKAKNKFLYHSGVADDVENMAYGITPTNEGPWIKEIAEGAVNDVEDLLEHSTPLSWYSDAPTWVKIKVARQLGKPLDKVTEQDILQHGHVAMIPRKGEHAENVWHIGPEGLEGSVTNLLGKKTRPTLTDLYSEGNYGQRIEPFGVEKNEYITTQDIEPMFQLTGQDLVDFLRATGHYK